MKFELALGVSVLVLSGCASTPKSEPTTPAPAPAAAPAEAPAAPPDAEAEAEEPPKQTAAEAWAEKRSREEEAATPRAPDATTGDPMAIGDELESGVSTKIELTPPAQIRVKSIADLNDGRKLAEKTANYDEAVKTLRIRLGKPNWIENGKKQVWVARDATNCYRLTIGGDGTLESDTVPVGEWRMLSAYTQQNACTGATKGGVPGAKR
jgi:hypothetical protein